MNEPEFSVGQDMKNELEIDGKIYEVDLQKCIQLGMIKEKKRYKVGDRFKILDQSYILCRTDKNMIILVNLASGIKWAAAPMQVKDCSDIIEQEMQQLVGYSVWPYFEKIK